MGITRLIQALKDEDLIPNLENGCDIYIAPLGEGASKTAFVLAQRLRESGVSAETDICGRSLKAQMKYADKAFARFVLVVGDNEIAEGVAELRDMRGGERVKVGLSIEDIIDKIKA
jgi:histidyl-tRNA synthetase